MAVAELVLVLALLLMLLVALALSIGPPASAQWTHLPVLVKFLCLCFGTPGAADKPTNAGAEEEEAGETTVSLA